MKIFPAPLSRVSLCHLALGAFLLAVGIVRAQEDGADAPPPPPPSVLDPVTLGVSDPSDFVVQAPPPEVTPAPLGPVSPGASASPARPAASTVSPAPRRGTPPTARTQGVAAPTGAVTPAAAATLGATSAVPATGGIMLNFQNASLNDVLNYLSEAAGFVIVQEAPVTGTVNIVSRQPISAQEAVDLVNTVLVEKGYVAIRNGRILKIVSRRDAPKRDVPVDHGSDPENIPRKDEIVTQIMPLRYGEAGKLVDNLRPLLSDDAIISANEGSNTIILTDTQTNVRRIAQIIHALDTSVSGISTLRIFPLEYADAKSLADIVTQLFSDSSSQAQGNRGGQQRGGGGGFPGFPGFGGGRGGGGQPAAAQSDALKAAARVVAVADEQSNSLLVSGPEELMPTVAEIVARVDRSVNDITETRVFRLINADAAETADILNNLYGNTSAQNNQANRGNQGNQGNQGNRGGNAQGRGGQQQGGGQPNQGGVNAGRTQRALLQSTVTAVGDARTNSLLVTASHDTMAQIAVMIGRLDATDARKQHVYVYPLEHADPDSVASVLRGMTGGQSASSTTSSASSRLTDRSANGASTDATLNSSSSNSSGRGTQR